MEKLNNVRISLVLLQTSLDWCTWLVIWGLSILFFFSNSFISMWLITVFPTTSIPHITFFYFLLSSYQRTRLDDPLSTSLLPVLDCNCWYKICPLPLSLKISLSSFTLSLSLSNFRVLPSKNNCLGNFIPFYYSIHSASFLLILRDFLWVKKSFNYFPLYQS